MTPSLQPVSYRSGQTNHFMTHGVISSVAVLMARAISDEKRCWGAGKRHYKEELGLSDALTFFPFFFFFFWWAFDLNLQSKLMRLGGLDWQLQWGSNIKLLLPDERVISGSGSTCAISACPEACENRAMIPMLWDGLFAWYFLQACWIKWLNQTRPVSEFSTGVIGLWSYIFKPPVWYISTSAFSA